ncbi:cytochrome c oxidase assembly protein [Pseudalkalibacillus caeni]|uniref:Cytochrome c oxidase assembly protein n=1 Tax=Exobacillus caeni TaxID=2574798 RepID=A0A5R9F363_9BACL|nr:cytochrome c oxidase assembly protein [Pseudalkalibacillus caeni]TLS36766.1 cytochrome c oxidase assembly protein [Pseudalkalibacillus caeni]
MEVITKLFGQYSFLQLWNFPLLLFLLSIALIYRKWDAKKNKRVCFYWAIGCFFLLYGTPLAVISDQYLFTAKMLFEGITLFIISPLLLFSIPREQLQNIVWRIRKSKAAMFLTNPVTAFLLFYGIYWIYHYPAFSKLFYDSSLLESAAFYILFVASLLVWRPVVTFLPGWHPLKEGNKLLYLLANAIALVFVTSPLLLSDKIFYSYDTLFSWSAVDDVQAGGAIVMVIHEIAVSIMIAWVISQWGTKDGTTDPVNVGGLVDKYYWQKKRHKNLAASSYNWNKKK